MRRSTTTGWLLCLVAVVTACTSDNAPTEPGEVDVDVPIERVTAPPERDSAFCRQMVELTEGVRSGAFDDVEAAIVETYRDVRPAVPAVLVDDFALVLDALERGAPLPTDPPRPTVVTAPPPSTPVPVDDDDPTPTSTSAVTVDSSPASTVAGVDVGAAPGESPADRINAYIEFTCRASANNPGPPPTEPGEPAG